MINEHKIIDLTELSGGSRKRRIKLPLLDLHDDEDIQMKISALSSKEVFSMLGYKEVDQLVDTAKKKKVSVESLLKEELIGIFSKKSNTDVLFKSKEKLPYATNAGTENQIGSFRVNKDSAVHRWYPYVEGFSADRIIGLMKAFMPEKDMSVYDPFGGSGTVQALASHLGYKSYYSELNPFMQYVCETKVNLVSACADDEKIVKEMKLLHLKVSELDLVKETKKHDTSKFHAIFEGRDYFVEKDLKQLTFLLDLPKNKFWRSPEVKRFSDLAVYCIAIACSNMTRRADLRRRRDDEYKGRIVNVQKSYLEKISQMIEDISILPKTLIPTEKISDNALFYNPKFKNSFDLILTSPPYLNGTNYFRNTKIEMGLSGFIKSEDDLGGFCTDAVCAGINNVSGRNRAPKTFPFVEKIVKQLEEKTYDQRITKMARSYFSDMALVIENSHKYLRKDGYFVCDIGDSIFATVHVSTHTLLIKLFEELGFELVESNLLRKRYSLSKALLGQYELIFKKK